MDMLEKPSKKTVSVTLKRSRSGMPKVVIASGFKLRADKGSGLIDISLEITGLKVERVTLDTVLVRSNLSSLKKYSAGIAAEQDDSALKDELPGSDTTTFANIVHFSQMGGRAETIFGVYSIADWVEATRQSKLAEVNSVDALVVISSVSFQKKLLLELLMATGGANSPAKE